MSYDDLEKLFKKILNGGRFDNWSYADGIVHLVGFQKKDEKIKVDIGVNVQTMEILEGENI